MGEKCQKVHTCDTLFSIVFKNEWRQNAEKLRIKQ